MNRYFNILIFLVTLTVVIFSAQKFLVNSPQYITPEHISLINSKEIMYHTETPPPQFIMFSDKSWADFWSEEINRPYTKQANDLLAYMVDAEHLVWNPKYSYSQGAVEFDSNNTFTINYFPPYTFSFDWAADPFSNRSWLMGYHSLVYVGWLAAHYRDSLDASFLDKAKEISLSWIRENKRENQYTPSMAWHDHTSALRLVVLTYLWEALRQAKYPLKPDEVRDLTLSIHDHLNLMHQEDFYKENHNHGFFQSRAVFLSAGIIDFSDRIPEWKKLGLDGMTRYLNNSVTSEGVHKEHSANYHLWATETYKYTIRLFNIMNVEPLLRSKMEIQLSAMEDFARHSLDVSGVLVPYGDSACCRKFPLNQHPEDTSIVYPESGFASLRNNWGSKDQAVHLLFTNSYFGRAHKHADNLGFHLSAFGLPWLVDAGNIGYERNEIRDYAISAFSHNTLVIDEKSMVIKRLVKKDSVSTSTINGPGWIGVKGSHRLYPGFLHTRSISYNKDKAFTIFDTVSTTVSDGAEHTFDFLFNFPPEVQLIEYPWGVVARQDNVEWELVLKNDGAKDFTGMDVTSGQTKPYLLGWYFPVYGEAEKLNTVRFRYKTKSTLTTNTLMYFRKTNSSDSIDFTP